MNNDFQDDYPSRIRKRGEAEAKHIELLVDRLLELRDQTDPANGGETEAGKDGRAFRALRTAGQMVNALAGWAIDHQVGLAVAGLSFVPRGPRQTDELPEYQEARAAVDLHVHERVGGALRSSETTEPSVARLIAVNLLSSNAGAMPLAVAHDLATALTALEINDVRPIVMPVSAKRKISLAARSLRLRAVGFVTFREALVTTTTAVSQVATAYGAPSGTVLTWLSRAEAELGKLAYEREVGFAKNAASLILEKPRELSEAMKAMEDDPRYGSAALRLAGLEHKAAKKERATAPRVRRTSKTHVSE